MQSAAVVALSVVLAAGTAAGVQYATKPDAPSQMVDDIRVDALKSEVATLQEEVERLRASAQTGSTENRQEVETVSDARIAAAVAKYLAAHPVEASSSTKKPGPKNLGQTFLQLRGDLTEKEYMDLWDELRASGQVEAMVEMFEKHATNNPQDPEAQTQLGIAYLMQLQGMTPGIETGKIAMKADKVFDKALKLNPTHWEARFVKAQALSFWPPMFGKQAEAISQLETLRKQQETGGSATGPRQAQTYVVLGNLYSQQGKQDKALEAWRKGSELFPQNEDLKKKAGGQ